MAPAIVSFVTPPPLRIEAAFPSPLSTCANSLLLNSLLPSVYIVDEALLLLPISLFAEMDHLLPAPTPDEKLLPSMLADTLLNPASLNPLRPLTSELSPGVLPYIFILVAAA